MVKRYLYIGVAAVTASALLYLFILVFSDLQETIEGHAKEEFNSEQHLVTKRVASQIEDIFNDAKWSILFLKQPFALMKLIDALSSGDKKEIDYWRNGLEKVYEPFLNVHPLYSYILFADSSGKVIVKAKRGSIKDTGAGDLANLENLSDDPVFMETIKSDIDKIYISRHSSITKIGTPVYRDHKRGAVIAGINMDNVFSIISPVRYGESSHVMLFTDKGEQLFCSWGLTREQHKGEIEFILKNPSGGYIEIPESHGVKNILVAGSALKVGEERWLAAIESSEEEIIKRIRELDKYRQRLMIILVFTIIGFSAYFHKIRSDRLTAEVRVEEAEKTSRGLEIINKELADSKKELEVLNKELNSANERLKSIDRLKSEFLATMSHELRTPLNSIIGFSKVILKGIDGPVTELQRTDLTAIHQSGQHLLSIINDILDLSKIESGKIELLKEMVDIGEIAEETISTVSALVRGKPIKLVADIEENLPLVYVDKTRIRQMILNILSNAAKFTDRGEITLTIRKIRYEDIKSIENNPDSYCPRRTHIRDRDFILVSVRDTGIGIKKEDMPKVFEEFRQIDSSFARREGGTGLGMAISYKFIELHEGEMWVESQFGKGSKFHFVIPVERRGKVRGEK
ncbi:MAG: hypothetical protein HZA00_05650 [Nitrospinae bacterium]|nr:hypothetical protein [Nitrospinota bacterium]